MPRVVPRLLEVARKTSSVLLYPARRKPLEIDQRRYWSQRSQSNHSQGEGYDPYYTFYNQAIVGKIGQLEEVSSILEVGCYWGERLALLRGSFPDKRVVGCDFGATQLSLCRRRLSGQRVELVNGDARFLPFRSGSFDLVLTSGCLQHVPYSAIEGVVQELGRVSRRHVMPVEANIRHMSLRQKVRYLTIDYFYMHNYEGLMRRNSLRPIDIIPLRDETGHPRYSLLLFSKEANGAPPSQRSQRPVGSSNL